VHSSERSLQESSLSGTWLAHSLSWAEAVDRLRRKTTPDGSDSPDNLIDYFNTYLFRIIKMASVFVRSGSKVLRVATAAIRTPTMSAASQVSKRGM
jgi:hypothetical protein